MAIDHLAFPAFDVSATHRFYTETLGGSLLAAFSGTSPEWGGKKYLMAIYELPQGEQVVFFSFAGIARPPSDGLPRDIRHVAFTAPSKKALLDWKKRFRVEGVSFWEENHGDQQSIYFIDPNDIVLEMTYPASNTVFTRDASAMKVIDGWLKAHPSKAKNSGPAAPRAPRKASSTKAAPKSKRAQ
jgi:glyoxylase I family protein